MTDRCMALWAVRRPSRPTQRPQAMPVTKSHPLPARELRQVGLGRVLLAAMLLVPTRQAMAETLQDAIAAAYESNPALRRARFQLKSVNENYAQARAAYGPSVAITGSALYQQQRGLQTVFDSDTSDFVDRFVTSNQNQGTIGLTVNQALYTGGQLRGQLAQQRATILSGQQSLKQVEQQLLQSVIAAYAAIIRDEARVQVATENVRVLQQQLQQNRARLKQQDVTATDLAQSEARLADAEFQLANLIATLDISRSQYLQVVGHNPGTLAALPDLPNMPQSSDEAYQRAEANNPQLLSAKYAEQASSAAVSTARGAGKPNVSISAQAGYIGQLSPFDSRNYDRTVVGRLTLTQPLFNSGAIRSRIRQAKANNDADQAQIDNNRRAALQSVTAAWSQLYAARIGLSAGTRQVQFAQVAFAGMRHEELAGYRETIETLNAEQELTNAQLSLLSNRYNEYVARAGLLAATGDLTVAKIAPDVPTYDAEADFRKVRNRGRTPLEPIVQAIDSVGAAKLRRPLSADLTGANIPAATTMPPAVQTPDPALMRAPLIPITKSPVVPAEKLPPGYNGPQPGLPPDVPSLRHDLP